MHYFDSSREALVASLKAAPWLVKPNRRELEIWAGRKLPELKDVIGSRSWASRTGYRPCGDLSGEQKGRCGLTLRANGSPNRRQWKW